ncbi:SMC-Scp complex subunit ScpB [Clostridium sp. AM42-4]|uniref:SMC-Scp complex subunit ScpB n=1 Tax=Clostridium sp. AM42-4 TaxID=2292305 RepID=UPI0026D48668
MGSFFDEEDEKVDLAAVEARHAQMEAEEELERLEQQGKQPEHLKQSERSGQIETAGGKVLGNGTAGKSTRENTQYHAEDWEAIIEAVLFTMGNSVELRQLAIAIDQSEDIAKRVVLHLQKRYEEEKRGVRILELENAYQMCTCQDYYENLIRVAVAPKKHVLTDVILETLSIIAYRQPVTKMEIGKIRGVNSDHAVNRLVEYGLVYEAGRLDAPGRPALFATTEEFLRRFGVSSMVDLPTMNPEQEEEIIQEVEEELQMKLGEQGEEAAQTPEEEVEEVLTELMEEQDDLQIEDLEQRQDSGNQDLKEQQERENLEQQKEESEDAEDQN